MLESHIRPSLLFQLRDFLTRSMGLYFSNERLPELERNFIAAVPELEFASLNECVATLLATPLTPANTRILAQYLTVGETYFFRDRNLFAYLQKKLLPTLLTKSRLTSTPLRIWSAGCCSGEEPYSVAMLLFDMVPRLNQSEIQLFASDINIKFLARAAAGVYTPWSFRAAPEEIKSKFFNKPAKHLPDLRDQKDLKHLKETYALKAALKQFVRLSYVNLADEFDSNANLPEQMDLIICRNVLIYFAEAQATKVIERFRNLLTPGGHLVLAPAEVGIAANGFRMVQGDGVIVLQKDGHADSTMWFVTAPGSGETGNFQSRESYSETLLPNRSDELTRTTPHQTAPEKEENPTPATISTSTISAPAENNDSDISVAYEKALQFQGRGDSRAVVDTLLKLAEAGQAHAPGLALLASATANLGDTPGALEWISQSLKLDNLNAPGHYFHALLQESVGRVADSVQAVQKALFLEPNFVMAQFLLGNLSAQQGKNGKAEKHYQNCLELIDRMPPAAMLEGSEGMTAQNLKAIVETLIHKLKEVQPTLSSNFRNKSEIK